MTTFLETSPRAARANSEGKRRLGGMGGATPPCKAVMPLVPVFASQAVKQPGFVLAVWAVVPSRSHSALCAQGAAGARGPYSLINRNKYGMPSIHAGSSPI
jgi:hypothetical protein